MSQPANAFTPDALISWCTERALADRYPDDATADYHTEAVLGYLTAVLDSLHEENPACAYRISGREFCGTFKSFGIAGGTRQELLRPRKCGNHGKLRLQRKRDTRQRYRGSMTRESAETAP